ncbi:hypothetical protein CP967_11130 [Streptomyces nitrosporeus]|uniref:Alpha/beta hydrolase n=1 Tax=Streptomyces nitrosporeus TaxID=28894 RepID=A0A5J6F8E1_9ACTN|nr:hypothetical protein [Streptomyces nitrosporeus]QEU72472.1 hypothetical protein CP967_11130 [Streptomyces nitrosporeus]
MLAVVLAACGTADSGPSSTVPGSPSGSRASSDPSAPGPAGPGPLEWKRCEAPEGGSAPGPDWRCATLEVPLDHAEPEGGTIGVALVRKQATRRGERLGSMLFDFIDGYFLDGKVPADGRACS